jgi:hypothetical protein
VRTILTGLANAIRLHSMMRRLPAITLAHALLAGWLALLLTPSDVGALPTAEHFKVILMPDTQKYTQMEPGLDNPLSSQTGWIKSNFTSGQIKFNIHLGDIINNQDVESQWDVASQVLSTFETDGPVVPYSVAPGNHDVVGSGSPLYSRDYSMYNTYFPVSRFQGQPWYGGHYGSNNASNVNYFSVGNLNFMVLALEILPRDSVLTWADALIKSHPNHRVIVETHKYLHPDGTRYTDSIYSSLKGNSGQQIFDKLIRPNPNVFMVVCGHVTEEGFNVATNDAGGKVYEILTDYQNVDDNGDGWMRVLDFTPAINRIDVRSYSPVLNQWNRNGWYSLDYDMGGTPSAPPPASLCGRWTLDDGVVNPTAMTALDATGNSSPALLENFATPPSWQSGRLGGSLRFDGANDRVVTGASASLLAGASVSVSLWIDKLGRSRGDFGALVDVEEAGDSPNDAFVLALDSTTSKLRFSVQPSDLSYDEVTLVGNTAIGNTDGWRHVAAVFQPGWQMAIYLDGVLDAELTTGVPCDLNASGSAPLTIGNLYSAGGSINCFNGLIDEVQFYQGCLTAAQVAQLATEHDLIPGDANDDGSVDSLDARAMATYWGSIHATWDMGDFNRDGVVNAADASILAANWGSTRAESAPVPEPAVAAMLLAMAGPWSLARRRRS